MKRTFSFSCFLLILIVSPFAVTGNLQNAFALTPVANLTGDWSGFVQITITGGYCEFTGKVNAHLTQNENQIAGSFTFVPTSSKSIDPEIYSCELEAVSDNLRGTIDGSRITLYSSDATLTGSYTSSGISLSISSPDYYGSTNLSPTGFTPPPFEPKEKKDTDSDGIPDEKDQCPNLKEDYFGKNDEDGCPEKDSDNDTFYDYEDRCPYDPEDFIGIEDGCPEVEKDSDGDGVPDLDDLCPNEKEDYLGMIDGCLEYFDEEEFTEDEFTEDEELATLEDLETTLDEWLDEPQLDDWTMSEGEILTETPPKFIEPPTPSVFKVTEETKPFFKALWDGKCDTLSHQYQLVTGNTGQLPIVCTGGSITLPGGELIQFSASDDFDVKLLKWGGEGLAVNYVSTTFPPVGALMKVFEAAKSPIETIKTLNLVIKKGEVEFLGGAIKLKASCATGNCKFLKTEEEGGGFKILDMASSYNPLTKMQEAYVNHNSVYILVEYASAETQETTSVITEEKPTAKDSGGCLIATATFGSELAPQIQFLREIRDNTVLSTASGTSFMTTFNSFYYSFSPAVADLERQNPVFKETVKVAITPLLSSLSLLQYVDIDSEAEMLGYGIGIILLNIGMYFVAPALIIFKLKNKK